MKLRCFVGDRKKEWMCWLIFSTVKKDLRKINVKCQRFISVLCFGGFTRWPRGDKVRTWWKQEHVTEEHRLPPGSWGEGEWQERGLSTSDLTPSMRDPLLNASATCQHHHSWYQTLIHEILRDTPDQKL